jgi:hypothetical protein
MIFKYKIHYKFYCVAYSMMIYLLYTNTRLGHLWYNQSQEVCARLFVACVAGALQGS